MKRTPDRPCRAGAPGRSSSKHSLRTRTSDARSGVDADPARARGRPPHVDGARQRVAAAVNTELTALYWSVGTRIRREIIGDERAPYGEALVVALAARLTEDYGRGFGARNLFEMIRFADRFPDHEIVQTLSAQLSWSHFRELLSIDDPLPREFYTELCRAERWSVRTLREKIRGMLYERTAISRKPEETIRRDLAALRADDRMSPDLVFRDPYVLDFLGLADTYSERDVEAAILRELERFLLELGTDFTFIARQKRITIDGEDYRIDLLFFHRRLRRLVAIDLKLGRFKAAYKGQMELYLRWLDAHERRAGEETPVGLILCAGSSTEHVELLRLEESGIRVAEYLVELPPQPVLERKLREALAHAREQLALGEGTDTGET